MTIQQLQYALAVYRAGSISGAASALNLAQPNLSGTIRALEEELGYPIFLRNSKGVQPTERGLEALSLASQMVDCHKKMSVLSSKAGQGRFRVGGVNDAPVCDAFTQLCQEYQEREQCETIGFFVVNLCYMNACNRPENAILRKRHETKEKTRI